MGDLEKTIEIIFSGVDELSKPISSMAGSIDSFADGMESIGAPLASMTDTILKLDAAIAALAGGAIILAATKAGEFSDAMANVNTMLNVSDEDFQSLSDAVLNYSTTSTQSLESLTETMYQLLSLGVDYSDAVETMSAVEQLAVAGRADMVATTESLIGTMNAYGAGMDEITEYSDAYFTIIKNGKTTLPELSTSLADVTSVASLAGIPFETLGAAIAAMTAAGSPTSQAITKIKAAIEALIAPTDSAKAAAEALGVEIGSAAVESKGFEVVLQELYVAAEGNPEVINAIIPSIEGFSAAALLGEDKAGLFAKALEDMADKTGATEDAFEKMKENVSNLWQTMLNNLDYALIQFGLQFEDETSGILSAVTQMFNSVGQSIDAGTFDPVITILRDFGSDFSDLLNKISANLPEAFENVDFTGLSDSLKNIGDSFKGLFDGLDLTTPEGLAAAIQLAVDTLSSLGNTTAGIVEVFGEIFGVIIEVIQSLNSMDADTQALVGNILALGTALTTLAGVVAVGGALMAGISAFTGALATGGALATAVSGIIALLTGPVGLVVALGAVVAAVATFSLSKMEDEAKAAQAALEQQTKEIKNLVDQIHELPTDVQTVEIFAAIEMGDFKEAQRLIDEAVAEKHEIAIQAKADQAEFDAMMDRLTNMPEDLQVEILAAVNAGDMERVEALLKGVADSNPEVTIGVNSEAIDGAKQELEWFDEDGNRHTITIDADTGQVDEAKKKIDEIPENKMLEIQLQGDIDTQIAAIEANAKTLEAAFKYTAEVDIAKAKADAEVLSKAYEEIGASVEATSAASADMFAQLAGAMSVDSGVSTFDKWSLQHITEQQMDLQEKALDSQIAMNQAQIDYVNAKTAALSQGDAVIQIDGSGIEPALEMIFWEVIKKVQVRVNSEAADMLMGI